MTVLLAFACFAGVVLTALFYASRNAITICLAEVTDGDLSIKRGGLNSRVLGDLRDVVRKPKVPHATIRIVRGKRRARVEVLGKISPEQVQKIRNVIGNTPVEKVAAGGKR